MSKFNTTTRARPAVSSPVTTERTASGRTFEGGAGYARDVKSELFLLAVTNMVGEQTFYETGAQRDDRYEQLVQQSTLADPEWTARMLGWLRGEGNLRSAALVGAAVFAKTRLDADLAGLSRQVVASVLQRPDEPGELLAYWTSRYGRAVPKPVKRGVADAVQRLYTERALLKYDTDSKGYRFADVLELVHATPSAPWQGDLFKHAIDRRHGRDNPIPSVLGTLIQRKELMDLEPRLRGSVLRASVPELFAGAGMTWEALAGWLQGPMDARAWEAIIPSMGYMSLLRNFRNFDEAGVSDEVAAEVAAKLADPNQVARSRQLPMRFLSAYRAAPSLRWSWALQKAITHSLANVPQLPGRTLVLVDTSGSMHAGFSKDGTLMRWDAAALFGIALASRCATADVVSFSGGGYYGNAMSSKVFPLHAGESLLRSLTRWTDDGYFLNGGTDTPGAIRRHYQGHDRVVILTDEQAGRGDVDAALPGNAAMYTWNLAGYQLGHAPSGFANRHTFGGLTDAAFKMIPLLEAGRNAAWPF